MLFEAQSPPGQRTQDCRQSRQADRQTSREKERVREGEECRGWARALGPHTRLQRKCQRYASRWYMIRKLRFVGSREYIEYILWHCCGGRGRRREESEIAQKIKKYREERARATESEREREREENAEKNTERENIKIAVELLLKGTEIWRLGLLKIKEYSIIIWNSKQFHDKRRRARFV